VSATDALRTALSGHYIIERELGRGGMATVFLARDLRHDRAVAVKLMMRDLVAPSGAERFLHEIRGAGIDYTIIRAGVLVDAPAGEHTIVLTQKRLALSIRHRIARGDVAEAFVAALDHPRASRTTFDIVWGDRGRPEPWSQLLDRLQPGEIDMRGSKS